MDDDLTADDLYLFAEGTHGRLATKLGAHVGPDGTSFAVWAPNAERVSVIGDFNGWNAESHPLEPVRSSGIWSGSVEGVHAGETYKFHIRSRHADYRVDKADPFAFRSETPPKTGSIVWDLSYDWADEEWIAGRAPRNELSAPMSIYEVHLGSWRRGRDGGWLGYRDVAPQLAEHAHRPRLHARRAACRSWNIRSTARGDIRPPATSRPRAGSARRRT